MSNYTQRLIWFGTTAFACDIKYQTVAYESFCNKFELDKDTSRNKVTIQYYDKYQHTPHKELYPFISIDDAAKLAALSKLPTAMINFKDGLSSIKRLHTKLFKKQVSKKKQGTNCKQSTGNNGVNPVLTKKSGKILKNKKEFANWVKSYILSTGKKHLKIHKLKIKVQFSR